MLKKCRVCNNNKLVSFFNLGKHPLANSLLQSLDDQEEYYPLFLMYCKKCYLMQLGVTIDPKKLFSNYVWVTGTSNATSTFAQTFYSELIKRASKEARLVIEIGSNDGTFLYPFKEHRFEVLGVDPAKNIVAIANKHGIKSSCLFFSKKEADRIVRGCGQADILFARNVLPHVANTRDFVEGLSVCLKEDGILAIEFHYAKVIQEELHYDSIYHEHLCYFTLKTIEHLLKEFDLYIFDCIKSPISGGSLIVYCRKQLQRQSKELLEIQEEEKKSDVNAIKSWKRYAKLSLKHRDKLVKMIKHMKLQEKSLIGYGASARSSTLLNFCNIDSQVISVIVDQNPLKQGKYTPGTHILIESPGKVFQQKVDCVVLLAWNFADEVLQLLKKEYGFSGKVIVPLPNKPSIVSL